MTVVTTLLLPNASPRDRIVERSRRVIAGYVAARELWNSVSSLSKLLRQMQREYEGRFLYELIQNAYDAQPVDGEGNIVVILDIDEGDYGVLYVANTGIPFTEKNFEADTCDLAQSDKAPDVSIGNKGIGFKSVIHVCQWPEIYSAAAVGQPRFEGYCFTFARPEQYDDLAGGDIDLASQMRIGRGAVFSAGPSRPSAAPCPRFCPSVASQRSSGCRSKVHRHRRWSLSGSVGWQTRMSPFICSSRGCVASEITFGSVILPAPGLHCSGETPFLSTTPRVMPTSAMSLSILVSRASGSSPVAG